MFDNKGEQASKNVSWPSVPAVASYELSMTRPAYELQEDEIVHESKELEHIVRNLKDQERITKNLRYLLCAVIFGACVVGGVSTQVRAFVDQGREH